MIKQSDPLPNMDGITRIRGNEQLNEESESEGNRPTRTLRPTEIVILQRERTNTLARGCENGVA
jgi:hypothetical protein